MSAPELWMDNRSWWVYATHPALAPAHARFHARNRFHLRLAMTQTPELEDPAYWETELARRQSAMQAGSQSRMPRVQTSVVRVHAPWPISSCISGVLSGPIAWPSFA